MQKIGENIITSQDLKKLKVKIHRLTEADCLKVNLILPLWVNMKHCSPMATKLGISGCPVKRSPQKPADLCSSMEQDGSPSKMDLCLWCGLTQSPRFDCDTCKVGTVCQFQNNDTVCKITTNRAKTRYTILTKLPSSKPLDQGLCKERTKGSDWQSRR